MNFVPVLLVGIGGALGSILRYLLSIGIQHRLVEGTFPWGTLCINWIGCFCIGLYGGVASRQSPSPELRLALVTGFLGGFTTFSAFAWESLELMGTKPIQSGLYVVGSTTIGILLAWLGMLLGGFVSLRIE